LTRIIAIWAEKGNSNLNIDPTNNFKIILTKKLTILSQNKAILLKKITNTEVQGNRHYFQRSKLPKMAIFSAKSGQNRRKY
jgi:hypothetical protein